MESFADCKAYDPEMQQMNLKMIISMFSSDREHMKVVDVAEAIS